MDRSPEFQSKFAKLQAEYYEQLPKRLADISEDWGVLCGVSWKNIKLEQLIAKLHQLAGTGSSFGLSRLTELSADLEAELRDYLINQSIPDEVQRNQLSKKLEELINTSAPQAVPPETTLKNDDVSSDLKILIVDDDVNNASLLALVCEQWGNTVVQDTNVERLEYLVKKHSPDLVLLDVVFPQGGFAGIDAAIKLNRQSVKQVPIAFMSSRTDLDARLKAVRAGGVAYITKPLDPVELKGMLDEVAAEINTKEKVLLIDDDKNITSYLSTVLSEVGYETIESNSSVDVIRMLETHRPDILLLDLNMPELRGDDILKILKQDPKYLYLSILFMTADRTDKTRESLLNEGAFDVLLKPINERQLEGKLKDARRKTRALRQMLKSVDQEDVIKQMSDRQYFFTQLDKYISRAEKGLSRYALANVMLKNEQYVRQKIGLSKLDILNRKLLSSIKEYFLGGVPFVDLADFNYLLVFEEAESDKAEAAVQRLLRELAGKELVIDGDKVPIEPCAGVSFLTESVESLDAELWKVDSLAKQAAESDEAIKCSKPEHVSLGDLALKKVLSKSLSAGRLVLLYQPIIDYERGERVFECFCRVMGDSQSVLHPDDFFHVLNDTNLKDTFNKAIINKCSIDVVKQSKFLTQSTEFILRLLYAPKTEPQFLAWLEESVLRPGYLNMNKLRFSLIESEALKMQADIARFKQKLDQLGCGFMLDKCGGKHTELLVEELGVDRIKLSEPFVSMVLSGDSGSAEVLRKLLDRDCEIIAGYIEDPKAFASLWNYGVRNFQGYFIGEPGTSLNFDFSSSL